MQSDPRLIAALDFPTVEAAKKAVEEIGDAVAYYKVGMELYYAAGNDMIRFLKEHDKKVFLDLKLQDIPNTVASALKVEARLGVDMINVHAVGGKKMMEAAAKAVKETAEELGVERPKLIAVTILTSMDEEQFADLNYKNTIPEQVVALAKLAKAAGLDGVVASPKEAAAIREACGPDFLIVTPGVRPAGSALDDQSRVTTPAQAFANGSTHIVVGRPIMKAENRKQAAEAIVEEIKTIC
ncbi:MAG: orotidine-5'-phosphate decarboxylase [Acidaminococcaceae bacterium]|nr:orotidine-5'-phosphate decarboxylase [Acidaminococcaceae bacterium]MBO5604554.1 orotidine-5'-phosphate decarboxylase [Acidaminococcaceae bacterium]MBO6182985.1 orotidine-5'-phosphate decarboxylase [Acidaminococcaceae bacterium]MBQ5345206.1 orotidine-5'-phosphate decarboxylase [Acidaminococcaceae bacterium]